MVVDTGVEVGSEVRVAVRDNTGLVTPNLDTTLLAEPYIYPSKERQTISVPPNSIKVLTGYNIEGTTVNIYKVLLSTGKPERAEPGCCGKWFTAEPTKVLHRALMTNWILDDSNPVFVIKTPGVYEVELEGPNGNSIITMQGYAAQDVNPIVDKAEPSDLGGYELGVG